MHMLMDMDSSTNVGTHLSYTYSSSVWCVERFEDLRVAFTMTLHL